ncbi:class I SAM-dependent DNA methyltransferase [Paenibacillus sp. MBLB4367]|uniref:class I SAM-dependent DNA methyltransferase n=1 Tax=Paenibacillus sp. MBLB4367 TaxID=3384767 RepID=UPI003908071E
MAYRQFASVYDRLMADMPYADWLRFADDCWRRFGRPATVVDLGCGTGTIAVPMAGQGFQVTGIDISEDMLAIAQQKSDAVFGNAGRGPVWLKQDMRHWQLPSRVDAVVSFCDCMNYLLEERDLIRTFRQTFDALNPKGLFVFDMHTPNQLHAYAESQPFLLDEEEIAYLWTSEWDDRRQEVEHQITFFVSETLMESDSQEGRNASDGGASRDRFRRFEESHIQRAYPEEWVKSKLLEAGFASVSSFADFGWEQPDEKTQRIFYVACKG